MKKILAILVVSLCISCLATPGWSLVPPTPSEDPPPPATRPPDKTYPLPDPQQCELSASSIGWALTQPDETEVTLPSKAVIATQSDTGGDFFYIEEDNRAAGIRVNSSTSVTRGNRVDVTGTLGLVETERCINASAVTTQGSGTLPQPLAMDNATVGGAALNIHTPGVDPIDGVRGVGTGPYNKGLLVRTWGRVDWIGSGAFCIDDGTSRSIAGYTRIKVQTNATPPPVGDYVVVTGVSSSFQSPYGHTRRLIRTRGFGVNDVVIVAGTQLDAPSGTIAAPSPPDQYAWNLIGLPGVPYWGGSGTPHPYASSVFAETKPALEYESLHGNLWRWDPTADETDPQAFDGSYIMYHEPYGELDFGPIYSGEGYWIDSVTSGTISYTRVLGPTQAIDRYIKLPYSAYDGGEDPAGGLTLIGYPFWREAGGYDQLFANASVTDGYCMLTLAEAIDKGWIDGVGYWWDNDAGERKSVGLPGSGADDTYLRAWRGYWIRSYKSKIALVIPYRTLELSPNPEVFDVCEDEKPITATLKVAGNPMSGVTVDFHTTSGTFVESGTEDASRSTNGSGVATVTLQRPAECCCGEAEVTAQATLGGATVSAYPAHVTFHSWVLDVTLSENPTHVGDPVTVTAKLTHCDGTTPVVGEPVTLTTTRGEFDRPFPQNTDANGEISAILTVYDQPGTETIEGTSSLACDPPCEFSDSEQLQVDWRVADDWPTFMHDIHHTGRTWVNDTADQVTLYLRWVADVSTATDELGRYCVRNGTTIPYHQCPFEAVTHPVLDSSPVHYGWGESTDGTVLVGTYDGRYEDWDQGLRVAYPSYSTGRLLAFNPSMLPTPYSSAIQPLWTFPPVGQDPIGGIASTPAVTKLANGETVIVFGCEGRQEVPGGHEGGRVYALYPNGTLRWSYPPNASGQDYPATEDRIGKIMCSSPVVSDGVVYIGTEWGELHAIDAATGARRFAAVLNPSITDPDERNVLGTTSPTVVNLDGEDYVIIGSDDGYVYKVGGANHPTQAGVVQEERFYWSAFLCSSVESTPSYRTNVYVGLPTQPWGALDNVFCLEPDGLTVVWKSDARFEVRSTPALSENGVFLGDETGNWFYRFATDPGIPDPERAEDVEFGGGCHVFASAALTSALAYVAHDCGQLHAYNQMAFLPLGNRLALKRFDSGTGQWVGLDTLNGWISSSPALSYAVDGSGNLWLFVTARTPNDTPGDPPGRLYCFGPQPQ